MAAATVATVGDMVVTPTPCTADTATEIRMAMEAMVAMEAMGIMAAPQEGRPPEEVYGGDVEGVGLTRPIIPVVSNIEAIANLL